MNECKMRLETDATHRLASLDTQDRGNAFDLDIGRGYGNAFT